MRATGNPLTLAEGETDAATLRLSQIPALGIPGANAAGCLKASHVEGFPFLLVAGDRDKAGEGFRDRVGRRLEELGCSSV